MSYCSCLKHIKFLVQSAFVQWGWPQEVACVPWLRSDKCLWRGGTASSRPAGSHGWGCRWTRDCCWVGDSAASLKEPAEGRNGSSNPHFQIKHKANWPPWLRPDLKGDVLVGYVEGDSCLFCVISIHRLNAQHCSRRRFRAPISQLKPLRTESLLVEIIYVIFSLTQDKYLSSLTIYKCNSISDLEGENGVSVDKFIHFNQAICFK